MSAVVIGMDPHKRSATIEVMDSDETVLGRGRYGTDPSGYRAMLRAVRHWPQRVWAIEGCRGSAGLSPGGWWLMGNTSWMCLPSCRPAPGCSPPGRAARPMRRTHTRSRWPRSAAAGFARQRRRAARGPAGAG